MLREIQNASALLYLSGTSGADCGLRGIWDQPCLQHRRDGVRLGFDLPAVPAELCVLADDDMTFVDVALLLLTCLLHWGEVKQDVRRLTDSLLHAEDKAREARREKPAPAEEANTAK